MRQMSAFGACLKAALVMGWKSTYRAKLYRTFLGEEGKPRHVPPT